MTTATRITDRDSALAWLMGRINYEFALQMPYQSRHFKLHRMERLLALLGDPQLRLPAVHIAGTKGKGSTAAMVEAMLRAAGYRTGLYTSPHLERIEERFALDGRPCDEASFVAITRRVQAGVEMLERECNLTGDPPPPTYFEITTAIAMLLFAERNVDVAVLEVGLGGRLDSTNVCRPLVSVITSISYDHMQQLGNTLASIAREKAGIIKPGVPVVSGVPSGEAAEVIRAVAKANGCRLRELGTDFGYDYCGLSSEDASEAHGRLDFWASRDGAMRRIDNLRLSLLGRHQAANAAVAIAVMEELDGNHGNGFAGFTYHITESALRQGLASANCVARIELISSQPAIVLDVAHNVASAQALVELLRERFSTCAGRTLIFGSSADKDARGILTALAPEFTRILFTRYQNNPRAANPEELRQIAQQANPQSAGAMNYEVCEPPTAALSAALADANANDLICVAGSFFLAAELLPLLAKRRA